MRAGLAGGDAVGQGLNALGGGVNALSGLMVKRMILLLGHEESSV
jgi:hypothetical protein